MSEWDMVDEAPEEIRALFREVEGHQIVVECLAMAGIRWNGKTWVGDLSGTEDAWRFARAELRLQAQAEAVVSSSDSSCDEE